MIDLFDVCVSTYHAILAGDGFNTGDQMVGVLATGADGDDGADFEAQTLYYDSEVAGSKALLDLNG